AVGHAQGAGGRAERDRRAAARLDRHLPGLALCGRALGSHRGPMSVGAPVGVSAQHAPSAQPERSDATRRDAARKFEALLVQQLLAVMRQTAKTGGLGSSSGASGQYLSMFDEVIAERMAEGGGIGLSSVLEQALGGAAQDGASLTDPVT